jgi:hypothetical protein
VKRSDRTAAQVRRSGVVEVRAKQHLHPRRHGRQRSASAASSSRDGGHRAHRPAPRLPEGAARRAPARRTRPRRGHDPSRRQRLGRGRVRHPPRCDGRNHAPASNGDGELAAASPGAQRIRATTGSRAATPASPSRPRRGRACAPPGGGSRRRPRHRTSRHHGGALVAPARAARNRRAVVDDARCRWPAADAASWPAGAKPAGSAAPRRARTVRAARRRSASRPGRGGQRPGRGGQPRVEWQDVQRPPTGAAPEP